MENKENSFGGLKGFLSGEKFSHEVAIKLLNKLDKSQHDLYVWCQEMSQNRQSYEMKIATLASDAKAETLDLRAQLSELRHDKEDCSQVTANRISELTLQLRQKELEMKEQYKREERNFKTTHKLKEALTKAH